ncbi:MAG: putative PEP-binding protein [Deltaproteobacteria bacterium]
MLRSKGAAVQKHVGIEPFTPITQRAKISAVEHGGRAKCLQRLIRLDMPVPPTVALSFDTVKAIAAGRGLDTEAVLKLLGPKSLLSVRPSSLDPDWGGPGAVLNIGMNSARHSDLTDSLGAEVADRFYASFVQSFAVSVARLDAEMFEFDKQQPGRSIPGMLKSYADETDEDFPEDQDTQLLAVLRSMARAWEGTTARLLRQARGAPVDAGLGLVIQRMVMGFGPGVSGSGVVQFADSQSGARIASGRFMPQAQGRDALNGEAMPFSGPVGSLEQVSPALHQQLIALGEMSRIKLREEMQTEFTIENNVLHVLDSVRIPRSSRAGLTIAVSLAEDKIISQDEAVMRIGPGSISELLHPQIDRSASRDVIARGIAASPGAAVGRVVFNAADAQASAARGEPCILVRRETSPEDIRGMNAAAGVLTEKGGMTSHAAVIARGLGLPCVVGSNDVRIDAREKLIRLSDGRKVQEGDMLTIDGTAGEALLGAAVMLEPVLDKSFQTLLAWADEERDIGIRANADTPMDAQVARMFGAEGIGLCRTEHMFFDEDRLTVMREMIFADQPEDRKAVLARLLPMQREDFLRLFMIMQGFPVCIRLFDPPLHEFLPSDRADMRALAEALDIPLADVTRRAEALSEYNPMLGMRGVRLGIVVPEIYDMQARAIFEAAVEAAKQAKPVVPEIMIPLVSAKREVEIVKARVDAVAAEVSARTGVVFEYRLGVMVETPRAALRAGEIAEHAAFLSFGTNDLTQMTYGMSRDDAGRFMGTYVAQGVFPEDPFTVLDEKGVGELLTIGAQRGREADPGLMLSICGEHGGNPDSIAFCRKAGFDYVSCSPYRVPAARLACAHLAISDRRAGKALPHI